MKFDKKISLSSQYSTDHKNYIEKVLDFFGLRNFLFILLATEVSNSKNKKLGQQCSLHQKDWKILFLQKAKHFDNYNILSFSGKGQFQENC